MTSVPTASMPNALMPSALLPLARRHFGVTGFRPLQVEAIDASLRGRDSLVVMPTGGGKSLCYQLPAIAVARALTVVVSPLIALMKDQVDRLRSCHPERSEGSSSAFINSTQHFREHADILRGAREGRLRLLYVSPERCMNPEFLVELKKCNVRAFVIDEAHCIASWGHDFRPAYAALGDLRKMFPGVGVHAFTATATERVRTQIIDSLGLRVVDVGCRMSDVGVLTSPIPHPTSHVGPVLIGDFDRPNLTLRVVDFTNQSHDGVLLALMRRIQSAFLVVNNVKSFDSIIYCNTRAETQRIAKLLRSSDFDARSYHAGLSDDDRRAVQDWFMQPPLPVGSDEPTKAGGSDGRGEGSIDNRQSTIANSRIVVATIAFGMGIDKPDVRFVIHYGMPSSLEVYHQEIGRAGRDGLPAECVMLYDRSDYFRWVELFEGENQADGGPSVAPSLRRSVADRLSGKLCALSELDCYCGVTKVNVKRSRCRHAHLVEHFGQEYVAPPHTSRDRKGAEPFGCNACDVCLSHPPAPARGRARATRPRKSEPEVQATGDIPLEVLHETRSP